MGWTTYTPLSNLQKDPRGISIRPLIVTKKCTAVIDQTMIIGERQIHHRLYDFAIHRDGTLLNRVHTENARLRRIEDWRGQ